MKFYQAPHVACTWTQHSNRAIYYCFVIHVTISPVAASGARSLIQQSVAVVSAWNVLNVAGTTCNSFE